MSSSPEPVPPDSLGAKKMKKWRQDLELWTQNNPTHPHYADNLGLLADACASDYLNRWNEAEGNPTAGKSLLVEAEKAAKAALRLKPGLGIAHYAMGLVYRAQGDQPNAQQCALKQFECAVNGDPGCNFPRYYAQYGNQYINVGQPANAVPLATQAINHGGTDLSIGVFHWILGRAYFFMDNYKNAKTSMKISVQIRSNLWYSWLYLASACILTNDPTDVPEAYAALNGFDAKFPHFPAGTIDAYERANPNAWLTAGLQKFHDGLAILGRYP